MLAAGIAAAARCLVQQQNDANKPQHFPITNGGGDLRQAGTPLPIQAQPLFGPGVNVNDGLPTYICAADAFGSYFTLQQMVMAGIDVQNGFHLGIVPFSLDEMDDYDISEEARVAALRSGQWDCLLTTADSIALSSAGIVTAVVDESAGADQLWARDVATINDLRDKRITYSRGSVGEYFVLFTLNVARLNPRFDVTLLPVDSVYEAVESFNRGQADVVSGWEPDIYDAAQSGGEVLLSSEQLRIIIDVIATSTQAVEQRPDVVQAFHNAWFQTLKAQTEDFTTAAGQVAAWGHNDWSFVYPESAVDDLTAWLGTIAQADLGNNVTVMRSPDALIQRLEIARRVWAASGVTVPQDDVSSLVDPRFVLEAGARAELQSNANPINDTFSPGSAARSFSGCAGSRGNAGRSALPPLHFFARIRRTHARITQHPGRLRDPDYEQQRGDFPAGQGIVGVARPSGKLHRAGHLRFCARARAGRGGLPGVAGGRSGAFCRRRHTAPGRTP